MQKNKANFIDSNDDTLKEIEVDGQVIYVDINFIDDFLVIEDISLEYDPSFEKSFVINCFSEIDNHEIFSNDFVFPYKEVQKGDTLYAVIANEDGDPTMGEIIGIFTEMPDKEKITKEFSDYLNKKCRECDLKNGLKFSDDYYQTKFTWPRVEEIIIS